MYCRASTAATLTPDHPSASSPPSEDEGGRFWFRSWAISSILAAASALGKGLGG